jgi:branched-subunit amino acid ABC-type transport system permease component
MDILPKSYLGSSIQIKKIEKGKIMPKVAPNSDVVKLTPTANIAAAVVAGAAGVVVGRFVWRRIRNRKASK